jgi:dynamin 1-like protein
LALWNVLSTFFQLLTRYSSMFSDSIDGKSKELSTTELCGGAIFEPSILYPPTDPPPPCEYSMILNRITGARINFIFNDSLPHQLSVINPVEYLSVQDIRTAIRNATGTRQTLFVPEVSFELLAKQQIARLEEPAIRCCHQVFDEMIRIVSQVITCITHSQSFHKNNKFTS